MNAPLIQPLRIGLIGLGQPGFFLFERLITAEKLQLSVAFDEDALARERATGRGVVIADGLDGFLATSLDSVVITGPIQTRAELGPRVLSAGHNLIVPVPIAASLSQAKGLYETAERLGRRVVAWSEGRGDTDFRSALATVRSGQIGAPRFLRFERWERMVFTDDESVRSPLSLSAPLFDQLTALVNVTAESVFVRPIVGGGMTTIVNFIDGAVASLTFNSAASTRLDHGWTIDGTSGGYHQGRRSVLTSEEEIYDVPAEVPSPFNFDEIFTDKASGSPLFVSQEESLCLVALISAAERSLLSGRREPIEPIR